MSFVTDDNREELGLPRKPLRRNRSRLLPVLFVLAVASVIGLSAGRIYRERALQSLYIEMILLQSETHPVRLQSALAGFQKSAARLISNEKTRLMLAQAYLYAADNLPNQSIYLHACLRELDLLMLNAKLTDPQFEAEALYTKSMALSGLNQDQLARVALDQYATILGPDLTGGQKAFWQNAKAYLLATSSDPKVRNPEEALDLAKHAISSTWHDNQGKTLSQMPAIIDTLAAAEFANHNAERALQIQTVALALADEMSMLSYLDNYDKYAQSLKLSSTRKTDRTDH